MSRIFAISRFEPGWRERPRLWLSAGDFALAALITLCLTDPPSLPWRFILRHGALMPLHVALFIETNPSPAKYALSVLARCTDSVRLPLVLLEEKTKAAVRDAMVHAGLIN